MNTRFTDKVVLVTGGGSGIGQATAAAFAGEGATVVVAGRRADALAETVKKIDTAGGVATAVTADVTDATEVAALVDTIVDRHGRLDIAFNNAGLFAGGSLAEVDEDTWNRVLGTNLTGLWLAMKYEIPQMQRQGGGVIVNMSSNLGAHMRMAGASPYMAAKAGASALTRNAALEYIRDGIRINAVSPGPVDTTMSTRPGETAAEKEARIRDSLPLGRVCTLDEIAATVLWLSSDESGFAVGHDLVLDGGASV